MKELAGERDSYVYVDALRQLFGLDGVDGAAAGAAGGIGRRRAPTPPRDARRRRRRRRAPPRTDGCDPCSLGDEVPDVTGRTRKAG